MTIGVIKPGLLTTVQDRGRYGYAHLGISPAGAADALSFRIANLLVGNDEGAPALEMTLMGPTLEFQSPATIAICGASCDCKSGGHSIPLNAAADLSAGSVLQCGNTTDGARAYLAVQGGFRVPLIMDSCSTDLRGRFGGFEGRRIQSGDILQIRADKKGETGCLHVDRLNELPSTGPIRVTRGAQHDWFSTETYRQFMAAQYTVSEQSDRAGLRLKGEPVIRRESKQLLTDGIPLGAIQVPQDGQPILLFVDQQTTGGYPKIANVISADMHRIGQLRPRDSVRFAEVSIVEAIAALRAQEQWLRSIFPRA